MAYTSREWFRTVGWGSVPKKYRREPTLYAVTIEPFPQEGIEYVYEEMNYAVNNPPPVKTFINRKDAEKEAKKWNTGAVVEYSG